MEDAARLRRPGRARLGRRALCAAGAGLVLAAGSTARAGVADALLDEARGYAEVDRHGRAVACALAALEVDPTLESEAALLIAYQLTWQERADEAVPWFRKHLTHHPGDPDGHRGLALALSWSGELEEAREVYAALAEEHPDDVEARLGLARMDEWRERHGRAAAGYREALAVDPGNREARHGVARSENARGRHRRAATLYREMLAGEPDDVTARIGLARSLSWEGRPDPALKALSGVEGAEAADLRREIERDRSLRFETSFSHYEDVDDQVVETFGLRAEEGRWPRTRALVEYRRVWTDEPEVEEISADRLTGGASVRLSASFALNAYLTMEAVRDPEREVDAGEFLLIPGRDVAEARLRGDGWLTWWPADWTRFDLGWGRIPIDTPKSLARGLAVDLLSLSASRRLSDRWEARAEISRGDYTDDNVRKAVNGEVESGPHPVRDGLEVGGTAGASWLAFDESPDRGYYSPEEYDALFVEGTARIGRGSFTLEGTSRLASERENEGDRFGVWSGGVEARWSPALPVGISLFAARSTSRFDTSAGYEREGLGVTVFWQP
jgi:tetratricopeptide (TPR) repeat protein